MCSSGPSRPYGPGKFSSAEPEKFILSLKTAWSLSVQVGDLIKVFGCDDKCPCTFCDTGSNRTGIIMWKGPDRHSWVASFDKVGHWEIWEHEAEVISESR